MRERYLIHPRKGGSEGEDEDGDGSFGKPLDPSKAGSNSDGTPKSWEKSRTSITEVAQLESNLVLEKAMDEYESSGKGSVPGELKQSLSVKLRQQPDPFDVLRRIVSASVASPIGRDYETMTKRHRRRDTMHLVSEVSSGIRHALSLSIPVAVCKVMSKRH